MFLQCSLLLFKYTKNVEGIVQGTPYLQQLFCLVFFIYMCTDISSMSIFYPSVGLYVYAYL